MATANKQAATIFRNYNETMKSICQHCGSHFNYFATELTDKLKVYEEAEQTMSKNVIILLFLSYDIYRLYIYHNILSIFMEYIYR